MGAAVRGAAAALGGRGTWVVNENEPQLAALVAPAAEGGCGLDAIWNDDWHHAAFVALTLRDEAYFSDYRGNAREFAAAIDRDELRAGAEDLGVDFDEHVAFVTAALAERADELAREAVSRRASKLPAAG